MRSDINGSSTCPPGEEYYETFYSRILTETLYQYDYRTPDGDLFSCCRKSLEKCREARDKWLAERTAQKPTT